jgi:hypothetical protein
MNENDLRWLAIHDGSISFYTRGCDDLLRVRVTAETDAQHVGYEQCLTHAEVEQTRFDIVAETVAWCVEAVRHEVSLLTPTHEAEDHRQ